MTGLWGWRPITDAQKNGVEVIVYPGGSWDGVEYDWVQGCWARDVVISREAFANGAEGREIREGWWSDGFWIEPQPTHFLIFPPYPEKP